VRKSALAWHRAPAAPVLLVVLAITTGWAQGTPPGQSASTGAGGAHVGPSALQADRATNARVRAGSAPEMAGSGLVGRNLSAQRVAEMQLADTGQALYAVRLLSNRAVPAPAPKVAAARQPAQKPAAPKYTGVNHVWIPSLGISRHVYPFACTRKREPGNVMYRWGCAGKNNVYLLGHASGVFKPLLRAYNTGRLRVGLVAIYADSAGHIRRYRVTEWQVVDPVEVEWAIASQPVPSMTLQTCVGPGGVDRLNVRLVAVR
jgi:sortase (surface protein transpeptidase)